MFLKLEMKIESFSSPERCFITTFGTDMFDEINFVSNLPFIIVSLKRTKLIKKYHFFAEKRFSVNQNVNPRVFSRFSSVSLMAQNYTILMVCLLQSEVRSNSIEILLKME